MVTPERSYGLGAWITLFAGASATLLWTGDVYQPVSQFGRVNYGNYVVVDIAAHVP